MPRETVTYSIVNDANGEAVIYVTQDPALNEMTLTLTFQGEEPVIFKGGTPVEERKITPAGPTSFYFTITPFLTPAELQAIQITAPSGWQAANLTSWVLTPTADLTVAPGQSFTFRLTNLTADGEPHPGSFNIASYNIPGMADNGTQLNLPLEQPPTTHKRLAEVLQLSFRGGDTVFIDGDNTGAIPPNTLILRLNNTSNRPIVPADTPWPGTPVFYLTFVTATDAPGYGALTTVDRLKNVSVSLAEQYGTDWGIQNRTDQSPPHWAIHPKSPEILGVGASAIVEFRIANIITHFQPSSTNLYLQSSGVPGYDGGTQALPLVKAPPVLAIQNFSAVENNVAAGTQVPLSWTSFDANRCEISPVDGGSVPAPTQSDGTFTVKPNGTTTYTLTAFNDSRGTRISAPVTVYVQPVRFTKQLTGVPATGSHFGDPVTLSWSTQSAVSCTIDPPIDGTSSVPLSSEGTVIHPAAAVTVTLTAQGQGGPVRSTLEVVPIPNGWQSLPAAGPWTSTGRPVMLPDFLGRLWFLAGGPGDLQSPVFRSRDGFSWEFATNNARYAPRGDAAGCVFGGKMWLLGGRTRAGAVNEIWSSSDGCTWEQVTATGHWSPRSQLGCLSFAGKIWVMGGAAGDGTPLNDVWNSTDGLTWTQVTGAAIWPARSAFGTAVFEGTICVVAGAGVGGKVLGDAWRSSDGVHWQGLGRNANWLPRSSPNVNVVGDRLYVIGGTGTQGAAIPDSNILPPDGTWGLGLGPGWGGTTLNLGSAAFLGAQWFAGGTTGGVANRTVWGLG